MSGLKEIKTRITSVQNTRQLTKAMKMVSVARLRFAQERILNLRNYADNLEELLKDVILSQKVFHPFFKQKKNIEKVLVVVMTSDRGLCGAFNGNICRFTEEFLNKKKYVKQELFFIGKKGHDYFKFRNYPSKGLVLNLVKDISYPLSARIAKELMEYTLSGAYDAVYVIYNECKKIIAPKIVSERFLPFDLSSERLSERRKNLFSSDLLLEVSSKELLDSLLERYFSIQIYRYLCENVAAEHGSRMVAMENATKNAEDVGRGLRLKYNKLRQSFITTELIEIVSGAEALK
ncbi:MAG: ATP synthase F1 subunit gamma [Bdellovibrionales bacterium]|nr:ATP synthase F1 subunit gamma [Bdellovibrionales bacterium]